MAITTFFIILIRIYGVYISDNNILKELSFGTVVLDIGMVGLLKTAIEMFENHRKNKILSPEK